MASHALLFSCSNQTFGLNNCKVGRFWCSFSWLKVHFTLVRFLTVDMDN